MNKREKNGKAQKNNRAAAIIVAAGNGSRMNTKCSKQFILLGGIPVLAHTLMAFDEAESIGEIIVVTRESDILLVRDLIEEFEIQKVSSIIPGGASRQESVYLGLKALGGKTGLAAIHDGARPFIAPEKIDEAVNLAAERGAAAVGVRVKDTIKATDENNIITSTPDRSRLWQIQTPQVFDYGMILKAHEENIGAGAPDDCALAEAVGAEITILEGSYNNIKITTPEDIAIGEAILEESGNGFQSGIRI